MEIINWIILIGTLITAITIIITAISKMLDVKLSGLYDNQRLQYRYEISSFAGDLRNGIVKTREEYQAVFEMYDKYETLIDKLKQKNHYIDNEVKYIEQRYGELK